MVTEGRRELWPAGRLPILVPWCLQWEKRMDADGRSRGGETDVARDRHGVDKAWLAEGKVRGSSRDSNRAKPAADPAIEQKFGPWTRRISSASSSRREELLLWGERLLKAESLSEVFGG